jgi:hypothetical protein
MSNTSNLPNGTSILPLTAPDLVCLDDLDANASETTSDLQTLIQDVYHVLIEIYGSNIDDVDRGLNVEGMLSSDASDLPTLCLNAEQQLGQDARIAAVSVTSSYVPPGGKAQDGTLLPNGGYLLDVDIQPDQSIAPSPVALATYLAAGTGTLVRVAT